MIEIERTRAYLIRSEGKLIESLILGNLAGVSCILPRRVLEKNLAQVVRILVFRNQNQLP